MKKTSTSLFFLFLSIVVFAQAPGDTIRVQAFNFHSTTRDTLISFPDIPDLTYEKIILKYGMRCKDGLVSTGADRNLGCGEWDYSCNTYLVDSTKVESQLNSINSHFITNFSGTTFPYSNTPVYDYLRGTQTDITINSVSNESTASIGTGMDALLRPISTQHTGGRSQYLYTAQDLNNAGLYAGAVEGISLDVLGAAGEAQFFKILLKATTKTELSSLENADDFAEVYYKNTTFDAGQSNYLHFHEPFIWDGTSGIIVEFNFTNVALTNTSETILEGTAAAANLGLSATTEQELILANNTYVECKEYGGISGSQTRTFETWVKTTNGVNGEIISWGTAVTGGKWVVRFVDGRLRLEVHGGGTESSTQINDGQWHHIACVQDGTNVGDAKFYIDGVLDANQVVGTTAIDSKDNGTKVRISRGLNNRYLDVTIDDFRLWDTALSEATINEWKNLKVDDTHPNYDNLQLHFNFNGQDEEILDNSVHGRNATVIGQRINVSEIAGSTLVKDFERSGDRPNITFHQGDYITTANTIEVDRPIAKEPRHFLLERTIEPTDPNFALDDKIVVSAPTEYWTPDYTIYDESTGAIIEQNSPSPDGEIVITELEYQRRFPFYNELLSFVTPYGIGLDFGMEGVHWDIDLSDYVNILKGDKRIQMTLGGQWQEDMDLEFLFIVGTPPRDVVQYEQVWQGTNRIGNARIADIIADVKFAPASLPLSADAETFKLKSSITGHGAQGEFQQNGGIVFHRIAVDQQEIFNWNINRECSFNPIFPQGGTWVYDRQGWCPGERSFMNEQDLTPHVTPGGTLNIDYSTSNPNLSTGDYRYHVAHQVVGYGPANFQLDASVAGIVAPNNSAEFTRVGTVCSSPNIVIQNTGATALTQLTIKYWLNDSPTPQTYEWTGNLAFMEKENVILPSVPELWFDILAENNVFHVEVSSPNQGNDAYSFNNKMSSSFDPPEVLPHFFALEFKTNNIPSSNSYQLLDREGNVVGSNDLPSGNTIYTDIYELPEGCYKLVVQDLGGDGLEWWANPNQGTGFVRINGENGFAVKTFEPDFGGGFEYSFTTSFPVSTEDLDFLTSIKVFPNPAEDFCTVEASDLLSAEVYLTDVTGRRMPATILSRSEDAVTLDLQRLVSGIYFVTLEREEVITTRKILVE